jgi:hypothetical protein
LCVQYQEFGCFNGYASTVTVVGVFVRFRAPLPEDLAFHRDVEHKLGLELEHLKIASGISLPNGLNTTRRSLFRSTY